LLQIMSMQEVPKERLRHSLERIGPSSYENDSESRKAMLSHPSAFPPQCLNTTPAVRQA
jgi:hypothetical protein